MNRITNESSVAFLEHPATQFGGFNGEIGYSVFDRTGRLPSRATHILEAIAKKAGFEKVRSINPLFHGENKRVSKHEVFAPIVGKNEGKFSNKIMGEMLAVDILGVSTITRTAKQSLRALEFYKQNNPNGIAMAGGPDATFRPEFYLKNGADIVVIKEAELTLPELLNRLKEDPQNLKGIAGIAYMKNGEMIINPERRRLTSEELSSSPYPFYDEEVIRGVDVGVLETTRGCPWGCDFCTVTAFNGGKYRLKSDDYVLGALENARGLGGTIFFTDDNLNASPKRAAGLLRKIREAGLARERACAQIDIRAAENPEFLNEAWKIGLRNFYCGIESINQETLEGYGKPFDAEKNKRNLVELGKQGFWTHVMYMPGGDGDNPKTLWDDYKWLRENVDSIQFMPPTPLPGSNFYAEMKEQGRILRDVEDFAYLYDVQHVLVRPKNFTPYELAITVNRMYEDFYSATQFTKRMFRLNTKRKKLVNAGLAVNIIGSGAVNKTLYGPQEREHLDFLKSIN